MSRDKLLRLDSIFSQRGEDDFFGGIEMGPFSDEQTAREFSLIAHQIITEKMAADGIQQVKPEIIRLVPKQPKDKE